MEPGRRRQFGGRCPPNRSETRFQFGHSLQPNYGFNSPSAAERIGCTRFSFHPAHGGNASESENYARAGALATPGEGTRPTGTRCFHSWWRTTVHGDSLIIHPWPVSSSQHLSAGLTPTGACICLRWVFLMCCSIFRRTVRRASAVISTRRGVSGRHSM